MGECDRFGLLGVASLVRRCRQRVAFDTFKKLGSVEISDKVSWVGRVSAILSSVYLLVDLCIL